MSTVTSDPVLLPNPPRPTHPEAPIIVRVARAHGVSPLRQMAQILRLSWGRNRVRPAEYYAAGLFHPGYDSAARREFVGTLGNLALNNSLSSPARKTSQHVLYNKLLFGALLAGFGLRTPETQAVFARKRRFGALPVLRSAAEIEAFLRRDARFPIFAKPMSSSLSVGSALILGLAPEPDALCLADGRRIGLPAFAEEVARTYPSGFLFQTRIAPHPTLAEVAGEALGTVRVVTVRGEDGPAPLYAVWKLPARAAMSDSSWQDGNMQALVDLASGRVLRCVRGSALDLESVEVHPDSGRTLVGLQMPHWPEVISAAVAAHTLFPDHGVLGWDIGITAEGPVILEANDNPFHMLYQRASGRGILNAEFRPVFDRLRAAALADERKGKRRFGFLRGRAGTAGAT
jgi:hypothetical protein